MSFVRAKRLEIPELWSVLFKLIFFHSLVHNICHIKLLCWILLAFLRLTIVYLNHQVAIKYLLYDQPRERWLVMWSGEHLCVACHTTLHSSFFIYFLFQILLSLNYCASVFCQLWHNRHTHKMSTNLSVCVCVHVMDASFNLYNWLATAQLNLLVLLRSLFWPNWLYLCWSFPTMALSLSFSLPSGLMNLSTLEFVAELSCAKCKQSSPTLVSGIGTALALCLHTMSRR